MKIYRNGVLQGGSSGIPGTPADVLLDGTAPNSIVILNGLGVGGTIPQSSIPDLPAAPASVLLNAAAPSTIVALDGSGVGTELSYAATRTAIAATPGATIVDPLTGADWTATTPAGMTATWASSKLTLSGTAGTGTEGGVTRPSTIDPGAQSWELVLRLQMTAGYNAGLSYAQSGYLLTMAYLSASNWVALMFYSNGRLAAYTTINGSFTNSGALSPAPSQAQATGGQLWWKLRGDTSGRWVLSWGVGSAGTLPEAWQRVYVVDSAPLSAAAMATAGWNLRFGSETTRAQLTTIDVLAIRSTWSGTL